jgi:N-acyl homoserine lactone hydrolase
MDRLYIIPCGGLLIDKGINLTPGYDLGVMIQIPVSAYLVESEGKHVLIDTGFNPMVFEDPKVAIGKYIDRNTPILTQADHILVRLAELDLKPEDIDYVICTHLHFDHAGGNRYFNHSEIFVQKAEISSARESPDYIRNDWDYANLTYHEVEGDFKVIQGVELITTPGHSAGHQSVLVRLNQIGSVLITGDAISHCDHWLSGLPGLAIDHHLYDESRKKLKYIAEKEHSLVLFSHDPSQWSTLKHLPAFYI